MVSSHRPSFLCSRFSVHGARLFSVSLSAHLDSCGLCICCFFCLEHSFPKIAKWLASLLHLDPLKVISLGSPFLITPLNSPIRLNLPAFLAIHSLFSMAVLMPVCVLHSNVSSVKPESDLLFTALCLAPHKSMPGTEYAFKNIC